MNKFNVGDKVVIPDDVFVPGLVNPPTPSLEEIQRGYENTYNLGKTGEVMSVH